MQHKLINHQITGIVHTEHQHETHKNIFFGSKNQIRYMQVCPNGENNVCNGTAIS